MKQSPMRKLRRDKSRLQQDLTIAHGSGDKAAIAILEKRIRDLDKEIAALEKARAASPE
jgi:hypothetical protein